MDEDFDIDETKFIREFATRAFNYSQDYVPVKTGFLKKSGKLSISKNKAEIVYEADYADVVEFRGSKKRKRKKNQPMFEGRGPAYMERAYEKTISEVEEIAEVSKRDWWKLF